MSELLNNRFDLFKGKTAEGAPILCLLGPDANEMFAGIILEGGILKPMQWFSNGRVNIGTTSHELLPAKKAK